MVRLRLHAKALWCACTIIAAFTYGLLMLASLSGPTTPSTVSPRTSRSIVLPTSHQSVVPERVKVQAGACGGMAGTGSYSLWLQPPEGPLREALESEIVHLADQHTGAPKFLPHVTLLGDIPGTEAEVTAKAQALANQLKPYALEFTHVARGTFFYQTVFLKAAETSETMEAAALARRVFNKQTGPYMPHLSLLYAELTDEQKQEVVDHSQPRLFGPDGVFPKVAGGRKGFDVKTVSLWCTPTDDRTTASWSLVATLPLQG